MDTQKNTYKEKIYKSLFKLGKFIFTSAPFALLLSVIFFWIENSDNDKKFSETIKNLNKINLSFTNNLNKIEGSLSTRHIGIFPNYLQEINKLLENANIEDTIIIFQDVLYYGIFSHPEGFKTLINRLINLAEKHDIFLAYYDINSRAFRRSVLESRINKKYIGKIDKERLSLLQKFRTQYADNSNNNMNIYLKADSIVCEKYFACSRNESDFEEKINRNLIPLYDAERDRDSLFFRIDEIKRRNIGKPAKSITFYDLQKMYRSISEELIMVFKRHEKIKLIGVTETHVMSCWLNGDKAILAFPSKYATDEIGFYTHDPIFSKYIHTMLKGVQNQLEGEENQNQEE
jgi:hypothetical protein